MLIIGIGNEYRSDDAAGLIAARRLRKILPQSVTILEQSGEGTALMDAWNNSAEVIVLDAVSSGKPAGVIHRFAAHAEPVPAVFLRHSTHAFSLAEAVELGRVLEQLPERLIVIGIEGKNFQSGTALSPEVEAAVDRLVAEELAAFHNEQGKH